MISLVIKDVRCECVKALLVHLDKLPAAFPRFIHMSRDRITLASAPRAFQHKLDSQPMSSMLHIPHEPPTTTEIHILRDM